MKNDTKEVYTLEVIDGNNLGITNSKRVAFATSMEELKIEGQKFLEEYSQENTFFDYLTFGESSWSVEEELNKNGIFSMWIDLAKLTLVVKKFSKI